jgi:hypothetical protein
MIAPFLAFSRESFPHAIHVMECIYNGYLPDKSSASHIAQFLNMAQEHVDLVLSHFQWTLRGVNSNEYDLLECAYQLIHESHDQGRPLVVRTIAQRVESYFRIWSKSPFSSMIPKHRPRHPEDQASLWLVGFHSQLILSLHCNLG